MTLRTAAVLTLLVLTGCSSGIKDQPATNLNREIKLPGTAPTGGGKTEAPQKSVKPES
jgi:hypothetical protein